MIYINPALIQSLADLSAEKRQNFQELLAAAQDGSLDAACRLAQNYCRGSGGAPRDEEKGFYWFAKAAEAGAIAAQYGLGLCYARGIGTERDAEKAVRLCAENMALAEPSIPHREVTADALAFVREMPREAYDLVILDPPAFAKHHKVLGNALQGYKRLNAAALAKMPRGGILFTFSCSQAVSREQFRTAVFSAAALAGRRVRILHQLTQPADHPVNIYHPEGEYLKGLVLYVE